MTKSSNSLAAAGRLFIGILFLMSGLGKLAAPAATIGYIAATDLPAPVLAYGGSTAIEVVGSVLLIAGYRVRIVAPVMAAFTFLTALFFHNNFADQNQMIHFMKNIAIVGGLLQVAAFGAGSFSLDARRRQPRVATFSPVPQAA